MKKDLQSKNHNNKNEILEIINVAKSGYRRLIAGVLLGIVGGLIFLQIVTPQYEAVAVIQPSTVGTGSLTRTQLESTTETIERLKLPTFFNTETLQACEVEDPSVLSKRVKTFPIKSSTLVQIQYRSTSKEKVEVCIKKIVEQLKFSQHVSQAPLIKNLETQLELTKKQIDDAEKFLKEFNERMIKMEASQIDSALLYLDVKSKREELIGLRKLYNDQSAALSEPLTQPLRLLEKINVSANPVFPNKMLTILAAVLAGFFIALLSLFARQRQGY